jgi:alkyl hydroperoxide reductase subunit AhpC
VHAAWRRDHNDLRDLKFPMLADTSKSLTDELCPCNWKKGEEPLTEQLSLN